MHMTSAVVQVSMNEPSQILAFRSEKNDDAMS